MVQKLDGLDMVKSIVKIGLNMLAENQYMGWLLYIFFL